MVNSIIRPPRAEYRLGPERQFISNVIVERKDFELINKRNLTLQCSWYQPSSDNRKAEKLPCLIYCHGNSGSRNDAQECIPLLLGYNITVMSFDFAGSGMSQGEYVSLGYFEKDDICTVVEHLRNSNTVTNIGIWGRSMGAATAIMYGKIDPSIACMVVDSPFSSLNVLASELIESSDFKIPKTLLKVGMKMIKKTVNKKANFDIE